MTHLPVEDENQDQPSPREVANELPNKADLPQPSQEVEPRDEAYRHWIFTLPNVICMLRIAGSLLMLGVAIGGYRTAFLSLFVVLTLSDWIDGWLARWLHQRSDFGARLDSFADAALYSSLILGVTILCREELQRESLWVVVALASYALTTAAGLIKYGKVPSYHTTAAKKTQGIVLLAAILLLLQWASWPIRIAASGGNADQSGSHLADSRLARMEG